MNAAQILVRMEGNAMMTLTGILAVVLLDTMGLLVEQT